MNRLWLNEENVPEYLKEEIKNMTEAQYQEAFGEELSFGTAGVRGILGAGTSKMNIFTVRKITLGLANYLLGKYPNQEIKVIVGYDSRNFSVEFSESVAQILASKGIKTLIFNQVKPTPLLSYGVRHFDCQAGIMITASHNPKEYNGYKVYNETGCQINIDEGNTIIDEVAKIKNIIDYQCASFDVIKSEKMIEYIDDRIDDIYLDSIKGITSPDSESKNIKIVFTPVHGTSGIIGPKALKRFGYNNVIVVEEQMTPDGNFTNVIDANPENIECYELALKYAKTNNAHIIVATDPDADRLGIMYKDKNNEYKLLTGNQTGALLLNYILSNKKLKGNELVCNTIVTGELGSQIVLSHGIELKQTLTGFKFIGEQIELTQNKKFIFGYEESYGYLLDDCVRDKDSIQALLISSEMINHYLNQGLNIDDKLNELYNAYGYYDENTYSISLSGQEGLIKIQNAMKHYRKNNIKDFSGIQIVNKKDYQNGIEGLPKADVIKFYLKDKGWVTFRPSGTEPKLKVYISIKGDSMEEATKLSAEIYQEILEQINTF